MKDEGTGSRKDVAEFVKAGINARARPHVLSILVFIILAFIAYSTTLNTYFLSDDFVQIGKVLEGDWAVTWAHETGGFFRPLFVLSYIVDALVWNENPLGYHLTNISLHALNSLLVCALTRKLLRRQNLSAERSRNVALAAGLLFLLHPSHTEAVSWISGRVDILPTLLCLASLLAFISYIGTRRRFFFLAALLCFALALLAKESAVSLPFILFAAGIYFAPEENRRAAFCQALEAVAPFFAVLFLFIVVRRVALGAWVGGYGAGQHLNFSPGWIRDRFLQAALRSLFPPFPLELSPILLKPLKSVVFILCAIASAGLIVLLLRRRRLWYDPVVRRAQAGLWLLLAAMCLFSLLPVINLRLSLFNTQGERFIYWPSVFTSILVAYTAAIFIRSMNWWLALMLCVLVLYSISLYRTNRIWRDAASLTRSIQDELGREASIDTPLLVVNAPDNLMGVPVFHNGLEEALRVFQKPARRGATHILALHDINSLNDEVELKKTDDLLSLGLLSHAAGFTKIEETIECLEILERPNNGSFRFRLNNCPQNLEVFFFNAGRMYRVIERAR